MSPHFTDEETEVCVSKGQSYDSAPATELTPQGPLSCLPSPLQKPAFKGLIQEDQAWEWTPKPQGWGPPSRRFLAGPTCFEDMFDGGGDPSVYNDPVNLYHLCPAQEGGDLTLAHWG